MFSVPGPIAASQSHLKYFLLSYLVFIVYSLSEQTVDRWFLIWVNYISIWCHLGKGCFPLSLRPVAVAGKKICDTVIAHCWITCMDWIYFPVVLHCQMLIKGIKWFSTQETVNKLRLLFFCLGSVFLLINTAEKKSNKSATNGKWENDLCTFLLECEEQRRVLPLCVVATSSKLIYPLGFCLCNTSRWLTAPLLSWAQQQHKLHELRKFLSGLYAYICV